MATDAVEKTTDGVLLFVRLTPKAARDALNRLEADGDDRLRLRVSVTAVPEKGKANAALIALLSKKLRLPKSAFRLIAGEQSRTKNLHIAGEPEPLLAHVTAKLRELGLAD